MSFAVFVAFVVILLATDEAGPADPLFDYLTIHAVRTLHEEDSVTQPALGLLSSAIVMADRAAFVSAIFRLSTFAGWRPSSCSASSRCRS